MAPQKRKHLHDAGPETGVVAAPARRSTRQHPDPTAEPEHQLRSGRVRAAIAAAAAAASAAATTVTTPATSTEKTPGPAATRQLSRGRKPGVSRGAAHTTNNSNPAVATIQTRTTRHKAAPVQIEAPIPIPTPVSSASKENVRPPTPPSDERRRVAQSKPSRRPRSPPPSKSRSTSPSTSQSRVLTPLPPQKPARSIPLAVGSGPPPAAGTNSITPKRTPTNKPKTPKPPGTPRSDRNIDRIVFGNTCFKAWYPSYYGKEVLGDVSANVGGGGGNTKLGGGKREPPMLDRLYICPCCFKYSKEMVPWLKHVQYCEKKAFVPGTKIYTHPRHLKTVSRPEANAASPGSVGTARSKGKGRGDGNSQLDGEAVVSEGEWSVWEVDGEKDGLFCQNLSLFAKLFLDNKSVFFDVTGFNYFLLVYTPPSDPSPQPPPPPAPPTAIPIPIPNASAPAPATTLAPSSASTEPPTPSSPQVPTSISTPSRPRPQIVGFFSKEKMSWDNNNLACILVFPPWQRKGLGALLMGVSYEISRREGILGGPEKPISELGRKGYKRFWAGEITRWILGVGTSTLTATEAESGAAAATATASHSTRHTRREKEKGRDREEEERPVVVVDVEQCSQDTWIVPEDCLAVLREMGVVEDAGVGPAPLPRGKQGGSRDGSTDGKEKEKEEKAPQIHRVRIDKAAVRAWARENRIELTRACDPEGFVEGYAVRRVEEGDEGE
ncbi:acyl-CoA N-acyltransferase [Nemania sp. FL0031]|nr:acyl-CoA N-acyltransferase [Nemania sp. FL0031]